MQLGKGFEKKKALFPAQTLVRAKGYAAAGAGPRYVPDRGQIFLL
jgi:hypothetical protein